MSSDFIYQLPQIPYLRLRFTLVAEQEALLPAFKGSMLRGAFGHTLRRTVCVMGPQQPCPTCMLCKQCVYPRLFETLIEPDQNVPRFLRGLPTAPRPYVFEPFDVRLKYGAGDTLQFDLILIGQATELHPFAIFAVEQMSARGLTSRQYRFRLHEVMWEAKGKSASMQVRSEKQQVASCKGQGESGEEQTPANKKFAKEWRMLYDGKTERLLETPSPQLPTSPQDFTSHFSLATCHLHFLTPTRLKFNNDLTMDFTFRMLVFKMLRRVLELVHFHVPSATIDWEFHQLLVAADAVQIISRDLNWIDWGRRSNRQHTEMKMGGFVGKIILEGHLAPFVELLAVSEIVHVGKGCVFGNGKLKANFKKQKENSK